MACFQTADGPALLQLMTIKGEILQTLDTGFLGDPTFTQDGKRVVYWHATKASKAPGGSLYVVPVDRSGPIVHLTESLDEVDAYPHVSPRADEVIFARKTKRGHDIWLLTSLDAGARIEGRTSAREDTAPSWSPDGGQFAFLRQDDGLSKDSWVRIVNRDGSNARKVATHTVVDHDYAGPPIWSSR